VWGLSTAPLFPHTIRGGADKYLGRPGRKQATATKLGIYSTYSPRSSIHFLAHCSNFCKLLKKIRNLRPTRSPRRTKKANFQLYLSVQGTGGSPRGQIRRIGWMIKTLEAQVGQFLLGCKCAVSRGIVVQEQDHLGDFPAPRRFSFNCTSRDE